LAVAGVSSEGKGKGGIDVLILLNSYLVTAGDLYCALKKKANFLVIFFRLYFSILKMKLCTQKSCMLKNHIFTDLPRLFRLYYYFVSINSNTVSDEQTEDCGIFRHLCSVKQQGGIAMCPPIL